MFEPIILILNGPKDTGKDFIADSICEQYDAVHCRFKDPLYDICSAISGIEKGLFVSMATERDTKETPSMFLGGRSPREFMIYVSEEVIKPAFGKDYFGQRAVQNIKRVLNNIETDDLTQELTPGKKHQFFIFSDGGFSKETIPMVEEYGRDKVKVIHLHREGKEYGNDSRRYLYQKDFPEESCPYFFTELYNEEGNPQKAIDEVVSLMHTCLADFNNSNGRGYE